VRRPADPLAGLSELDAAAVVRCVRALLRQPWLRESSPDGAILPLVHRHRVVLGEIFGSLLGYRLVVRRGWARLYKTGRGDDASRGEPAFSPRTYAFLAVTIAVLEGGGRQTLLSRLVQDVHAAAVEAGLAVADDAADRAALSAALRHLLRLGAITETEGTVNSVLGEQGAEALITVDRDLIAELMIGPVSDVDSPAALLVAAGDPGVAGAERAVRRELIENPAVFFADLPDDGADWLRSNRRAEARSLETVFGLLTESRQEGIAVTDPEERLTDIAFPGQSTLARLAMLAIPDLLDVEFAEADEEFDDAEDDDGIADDGEDDHDGTPDGRVAVSAQRLREVCRTLVEDHAGTWSAQETADLGRLTANVAELLVMMRVAGRDEAGTFWLNPVAHRYVVTAEGAGAGFSEPAPVPERTASLFGIGNTTGEDRS
jgi:uncharacterized protein (TIGR02678 family)